MNRRRHSPDEIVRILKEVEAGKSVGRTIGDLCRTLGIRPRTYHRWRRRYAGLGIEHGARIEALEEENYRLKKVVAEQAVDIAILLEAGGRIP